MQSSFQKNFSIIIILILVGLQFCSYLGSSFLVHNLPKPLHGYTKLESNLPYLVDWVWVTLIGRILGAYTLCKLAQRMSLFFVMRIVIATHVILAILISYTNLGHTLLYQDSTFLFVYRFLRAFIFPATFLVPSLLFLNYANKKSIMLSAYVYLAIGLSAFLIYSYLEIFSKELSHKLFYIAILMGIVYIIFEKYNTTEIKNTPETTHKATLSKIFLVSVFGGTCGITVSYHFAFIDSYVNTVILSGDYQNISFSYYYYTILISIIPVAKFIYKTNSSTQLKVASIWTSFIALTIAVIPEISLNVYIAEQIAFGLLTAVLIVPSQALVYQIFKGTHNCFEGIFWFISCFSLFSVTPHFFVKLLGVASLPWLSLLYILPISLLLIFAISKYEQKHPGEFQFGNRLES